MSLKDMTVKSLRTYAKAYGLTGYSRLNKADLVQFITDNAKLPSVPEFDCV